MYANLRKIEVVQRMGDKCSKCGVFYPLSLYDIHHTDPSKKKFEINTRTVVNKSWGEIWKEAAKCILLCANCHRLEHLYGE